MEVSKEKNEFLLYIFLIIFIFLLIQVVYSRTEIKQSKLADPDCYMRLVRVEQLAETGEWYDSVIHRSNYPYGDELHWTRPLDVILLAGACLLTPFQGFPKSLLSWGIVISPILGIFSLLALQWALRSVLNNNSRRLLLLMFISQPLLVQIFLFCRPDHHSLLMLLFILNLGFLFRMTERPDKNRNVLIGGLIASLALWVSVESIFAIFMVYLTLGVLWLVRGQIHARQLLLYSLSLFVFSSIFLCTERPLSSLFSVAYDKISIVYLFVFMVAVLASYLLTLITNSSLYAKLIKTTLILLFSGLAIWWIFPSFYHGPMAGVNPDIVPIWLSKVSEAQPLWSAPLASTIVTAGTIIFFGAYLIYLMLNKRIANNLNLLLPIICGFITFLPLGLCQIRMDYYLLVIMIVLLAMCLDDILEYIGDLNYPYLAKSAARVTIMLFFFLGLPAAGILASSNNESGADSIEPDLKPLCVFLNDYQTTNPQVHTVLTMLDFGPEILYRTNYNIIAGPYHRNDQGILYIYSSMTTTDFTELQAMLKERSVDLLILCPKSSKGFYSSKTADHFTCYKRLVTGETPAYLANVDLPGDLAQSFIMFRVKE